jgi:anti-anti-sigma factor
MTEAQIWKGSKFSIERIEGEAAGTVVYRLSGPFTARDMYGSMTPVELRNLFESAPNGEQSLVNIFDLTDVPYMDSAGLGMIVSHYVRCHGKGVQLIAVGVSPRVLQLFKMTKVESLIPMTGAAEEGVRQP